MLTRERWDQLLTRANELRAAAFEFDLMGLHELANATMRELENEVRQSDVDSMLETTDTWLAIDLDRGGSRQ